MQTEAANGLTPLGHSFTLLKQHAGIGSWSLDLISRRYHWDREVGCILGCDTQEAVCDALAKMVHPNDRAEVERSLQYAIQVEGEHNAVFRIRRPDRVECWVECWARPRFDREGRAVSLDGTLQDITWRKQAEEVLRESADTFRRMAERAPDLFYRLSLPDGNLEYISSAASAMLGYGAEELTAYPELLEQMIHPGDRSTYTEYWGRLKRGEEAKLCDYRILHKSGQIRTLCQRNHPVRNGRGRVIAVEGIVTDLTQSRRMERELVAERKRAAHYLDIASVMIVALDDRGCITLANRHACKVLGYDRDELLGMNWFDNFLSESVRPPVHEVYRRLMSGDVEPVLHYENAIQVGDGGQRIVAWNNSVLRDEEGKICGVLSSGEDVTSQRRNEERLRQVLEETIQAISRTVEARDPYTAGHQRRVSFLAEAIGREMGHPEHELDGLRLAGMIHDIGKIYIPSELLNRPGKLTEAEFELIKSHPEVGYRIIGDVEFPWPVADIILQHHERLDGSGYPNGLKGEEICMGARLLVVADVVEAISSHRPYRPSLGVEKALAEIKENRGRLYDPDAVDACLRLFREKGFRLPEE